MNRDEFSEVYLFFDYDGHNNNLPKNKDTNEVLRSMLETFNNETENGKMLLAIQWLKLLRIFQLIIFATFLIDVFQKYN